MCAQAKIECPNCNLTKTKLRFFSDSLEMEIELWVREKKVYLQSIRSSLVYIYLILIYLSIHWLANLSNRQRKPSEYTRITLRSSMRSFFYLDQTLLLSTAFRSINHKMHKNRLIEWFLNSFYFPILFSFAFPWTKSEIVDEYERECNEADATLLIKF